MSVPVSCGMQLISAGSAPAGAKSTPLTQLSKLARSVTASVLLPASSSQLMLKVVSGEATEGCPHILRGAESISTVPVSVSPLT